MVGQFIAVEGVDGSGKTTLAERIAEEYGAEYQHVGPPRADTGAFHEHVEYALACDERGRTVFDRFHFGCFAYGPIFRSGDDRDGIGDFRRPEWDFFEELVRPHCLIVLCDPGWDVIRRWWGDRGDDRPFAQYEDDLDKLALVYKRFQKAAEVTTLALHRYDYTRGEGAWAELAERIEEKLTWTPG